MRPEGDKVDNIRRRVLNGLLELQKVKKVACVLIWTTEFGTSFFGTEKLKIKAQKSFDCTCLCSCGHGSANSWQHELEDDEKALIENGPMIDNNTTDLLNHMYADAPVEKLPSKLELMVYNDLSKWVRKQILKDRHERGYSGKKIVYKDMTWKPSFWPDDLCDWREVSNFAHWKKEDVTTGTDLTTILKRAVELRLRSKGIEPADHVASNVDVRKQKRKQKWRGIHNNPTVFLQDLDTVHAAGSNDPTNNNSGNRDDENDEDVNEVNRDGAGDVDVGQRELNRSTDSHFSTHSFENLSAPNVEDMEHAVLDDDEEDGSAGDRGQGDSETEVNLGADGDVGHGGLNRSTHSQGFTQYLESLSAPNVSFIETSRPSSRRVSARSSFDDDVFMPSRPQASCSGTSPRYPIPAPEAATRAPSSQPMLSNSSFVESSRPSLSNSGPVSSAIGGGGSGISKRKPRRLRPSELNNPELYQYKETIKISAPKRSRNEIHPPNSNSWNRYNSLKNIRDVTTGQLDIGTLPIKVSPELIEMFLAVSEINTSNEIETGGLLGGVLEDSRRFVVTELILPKQTGRRDFWEAHDAPQIQEYFTTNGLIILGSIHIHPPPAESFLSSVDLHQQFDFQKDIPSAISIVLAPAHMPQNVPAYAYSLTDLGLTVLADCKKAGFHQHRERSGTSHRLYTEADHLIWSPDINTNLADLRDV